PPSAIARCSRRSTSPRSPGSSSTPRCPTSIAGTRTSSSGRAPRHDAAFDRAQPAASGAGIGVAVPAAAPDRTVVATPRRGLRRRGRRRAHTGDARARDEPPARVLHPTFRLPPGVLPPLDARDLLRVQGRGALLRPRGRGARGAPGGVVLPEPGGALRRA